MADLFGRLMEHGLVTQEQGHIALLEAARTNQTVWFALVKLDYLSEEIIVRFFAQEAQISYVHIPDYRIKQGVLRILDEHFCRQNTVIPLFMVQKTLFVACSNPFNMALLDSIGKLSGSAVEPLIATSTAIIQALDYYWRIDTLRFDIAKFIVSPAPVKGLSLWRKSDRIAVDCPASVVVQDEFFAMSVSSRVEGRSHDISRDGNAIGIYLPLYVPKGVKVLVVLSPEGGKGPSDNRLEFAGETVHSFMQNTQKFSVGIRFSDIDAAEKKKLLDFVGGAQGGEQ
ncbi:MAG: PilZ domain-containing protein [Candidatus Omnitrophota bacterium]